MSVTTNERDQHIIWPKEPTEYYHNYGMQTPNEWKETYNGRWAMIGIVSGIISYALTGNFFFGIF